MNGGMCCEADTRRVFILKDGNREELKCYGCGWRVSRLYVLASSEEHALELYNLEEAGLCGDCFSEMLSEATNGGEIRVIYVRD